MPRDEDRGFDDTLRVHFWLYSGRVCQRHKNWEVLESVFRHQPSARKTSAPKAFRPVQVLGKVGGGDCWFGPARVQGIVDTGI